jgi:hypothetical protein
MEDCLPVLLLFNKLCIMCCLAVADVFATDQLREHKLLYKVWNWAVKAACGGSAAEAADQLLTGH